MIAALAATGLVLIISGLVLNRIVEERRRQRQATIASNIAQRRATIVANIALGLRHEALATTASVRARFFEEKEFQQKLEQTIAAEAKRKPRVNELGKNRQSVVDMAEALYSMPGSDWRIANFITAIFHDGVVEKEASTKAAAVTKHLLQIVDLETRTFRLNLSTAAPFLSDTPQGEELLRAGFEVIRRLRSTAKSANVDEALAKLADSLITESLSDLEAQLQVLTQGLLEPEKDPEDSMRELENAFKDFGQDMSTEVLRRVVFAPRSNR